MTRALAIPDDGRVVTACCGGHRPASDCLCCDECISNADIGRQEPEIRAAAARAARGRATQRRLNARRAEHAVTVAAIDDLLRSVVEGMANVVRQANAVHEEFPAQPVEQNRWFTHMQGVLT